MKLITCSCAYYVCETCNHRQDEHDKDEEGEYCSGSHCHCQCEKLL